MNSIAGESGPRIVGDGSGELGRRDVVDTDGDCNSEDVDAEGEGSNVELVDGDVGSYTGGGTKLALTRDRECGPAPASIAAWRSEA